jgi:hypothetical protein
MMSVQLSLGVGGPTIGEQFPEMDEEYARHHQRDSEAITRLYVRGVITHTERVKAEKRLVAQVAKSLRKARNV